MPGCGFKYATLLGGERDVWETDVVAVRKFGKWQILDSYDRLLVPSHKLDYDCVSSWTGVGDRYIEVRKDGKVGLIDRNRDVVIASDKYNNLSGIPGYGLYKATVWTGWDSRGEFDSKSGIVNVQGTEIWSVVYEEVSCCSEGYIRVKDRKGYGFVLVPGPAGRIGWPGRQEHCAMYAKIGIFADIRPKCLADLTFSMQTVWRVLGRFFVPTE